MMTPSSAATVPSRDEYTTNEDHCAWCLRSGVKYIQCGIAPIHAQKREGVVVYCTTSAVTPFTYTCWPSAKLYLTIGRSVRSCPATVHWSTSVTGDLSASE